MLTAGTTPPVESRWQPRQHHMGCHVAPRHPIDSFLELLMQGAFRLLLIQIITELYCYAFAMQAAPCQQHTLEHVLSMHRLCPSQQDGQEPIGVQGVKLPS